MNDMQNTYGPSFSRPNLQPNMDGYAQDANIEGLNTGPMVDATMIGHGNAQTLDQIISQNYQESMRRRQTYIPQYRHDHHSHHGRRSSMLEFGSTNSSSGGGGGGGGGGDHAEFQFDPSPQHADMPNQVAGMMPTQKSLDPRKVRSRDDLSINTGFAQISNYDGPMTAFPNSMIPSHTMNVDQPASFLPTGMDMGGDYDAMATNLGQMNMTSNRAQQGMYTTSPITANFSMPISATKHDPGGGGSVSLANSNTMRPPQSNASSSSTPQRFIAKPQNQTRRNPMMPSALSLSAQNSMSNSIPSTMASPAPPHVPPASTQAQHQPRNQQASVDVVSPYLNQHPAEILPETGERTSPGMASEMGSMPPQLFQSKWANAYSTTGFDMLAVLMRVATRPNPQINIGPVDLACAFVVCDIDKHDLPIVYCSDMFERLTGYSRHEILGRNCRFLQSPDGKVQSGVKRKYVDDKSVLYLKNRVNKREEAQLSIINYRKGGQPFMNLLTMIPITWDTEELKYFVGFQVDLVEQPNSVSAKNPDGTYEINYNRSALPAYRLPAPDPNSGLENMGGQTISRDDVSQVLATIGNGETDLSRRIWDKVLLENTDDVVHVLSLKGLFLYLSPACKNILEYDPSELVGTALSAVCHPSDIVPVTRELKDSSTGAPVNVVYRIRRKNTGYTWFEAHGCLHTEQGKGRKCIILVGRQRPVFVLDKNEITFSESGGDAELWTKISTAGMFLYVSSSSRAMLDRLPDDLVGTSMQSLMRLESRKEFERVLELARMGEKSTFKHDLQNRRGQVLQAQTTIYPGDARKGLKPTFLLGQTRLLKMTRAMLLSQKTGSSLPRPDRPMGSATPLSSVTEVASISGLPRATAQIATMQTTGQNAFMGGSGILTQAGSGGVPVGSQDEALASEDNIFDELKTTRSTSWQFELRQMERQNRLLSEELQTLLSRKKKRKRRKGMGNMEKDCANCHTRVTPEWRRGPSGQRDLCNSCGLRWAKQNGRVSPRKGSGQSDRSSTSPQYTGVQQQSTRNPLGNKEATAETQASSASQTSGDGDHPARKTLKHESSGDSREPGQTPSVIEEGQEPPHAKVLPT